MITIRINCYIGEKQFVVK